MRASTSNVRFSKSQSTSDFNLKIKSSVLVNDSLMELLKGLILKFSNLLFSVCKNDYKHLDSDHIGYVDI